MMHAREYPSHMPTAEPRSVQAVVIGRCHDTDHSQEFRLGRTQLLQALPAGAFVHDVNTQEWPELWRQAQAKASALPPEAAVLLLRHSHQVLAPGSVEALRSALDDASRHQLATVAVARDPQHPPANYPPDYCTVRGMERYASAMHVRTACSEPCPPGTLAHTLACAVSARTLIGCSWHELQAVWAKGAWTHDFSGYQSGAREEVIELVPTGAKRVLDVGGGQGHFLRTLKTRRGCETHLAEYSLQACEPARAHVDCVWQGDFLAQPIDARFDCVTFLDVIEHAAEPLPWLERARSLLNPGGCIVASIPNVGHWSVVADLLEGRWDYAPVGIHCITHLRFYTRHGIEALMNEAGLRITQMKATQVPMPAWMDGVTHLPGLRVDQTSLDAYNWLLCAEPC